MSSHRLNCLVCFKTFNHWYPRAKFCTKCLKPHKCKCGCGKLVKQPDALYIHGHDPKVREKLRAARKIALTTFKYKRVCDTCERRFKTVFPKQVMCDPCRKPKLCKCGCGCVTKTRGAFYVRRHDHPSWLAKSLKDRRRKALRSNKPLGPYILSCRYCGNDFEHSYPRAKHGCQKCNSPRKCKCGCKAILTYPGCFYANGHHPNQNSPEAIAKIKKALRRPEVRAAIGKSRSGQAHKASKPELELYAALDQRIFRHTGQESAKYGQPISADILAPCIKFIIQVDGCYWHECPQHGSGAFPHKRDKDRKLTKYAEKQGWTVIRIWQHDIVENLSVVLKRINKIQKQLRKRA